MLWDGFHLAKVGLEGLYDGLEGGQVAVVGHQPPQVQRWAGHNLAAQRQGLCRCAHALPQLRGQPEDLDVGSVRVVPDSHTLLEVTVPSLLYRL